jgi:GxxExxY protein
MEHGDTEDTEATEKEKDWNVVPHLRAISRHVVGAAIEVHRSLGPGFLEGVYEEALAIELEVRGIPFQRQVRFPVSYRDRCIGESRLDFLIDEEVVVELKEVEALRPIHRAQVLSYLRAGFSLVF